MAGKQQQDDQGDGSTPVIYGMGSMRGCEDNIEFAGIPENKYILAGFCIWDMSVCT